MYIDMHLFICLEIFGLTVHNQIAVHNIRLY